MLNVPVPADRVQDPLEKNMPGKGLGRDPSRTPMLWDATPYAGFSDHPPWLPVTADHSTVSVEYQSREAGSFLALYGVLLRIRKSHPSLSIGDFARFPAPPGVLAYLRAAENERLLIALNFGAQRCEFPLGSLGAGRILLSTYMDRADERLTDILRLRGNEGIIVMISEARNLP
jgi:alpha-glucosidase